MKVCSNCEKKIGELANYCFNCGRKLNPLISSESFKEAFDLENEAPIMTYDCNDEKHIFTLALIRAAIKRGLIKKEDAAKFCSDCGEKLPEV